MEEEKTLLNYQNVLDKIENQENHLLLANGFNQGLGVNTSYKEIFSKMLESNLGIYKDALEKVKKHNYDLELFIGDLESDIKEDNLFLRKYVRNKIKLDFMTATQDIVKSSLKNIYAEKNEGVFILFKQFTNFFTLNYDPFLYQLLLQYKPISNTKNNSIIFNSNVKYMEDDLNEQQNNIYKEIKKMRKKGNFQINPGDNNIASKNFQELKKTRFVTMVQEYSEKMKKNWQKKDIEKVVKMIIDEENRKFFLEKVDDGSRQLPLFDDKEFFFDIANSTQNVFFLHGAFHIFEDKKSIKKITQTSDKALYDRLEEILNDDTHEIVCVFQQNQKIDAINKNAYLTKCFKKLGSLNGNLVIIGSSMSDNDSHIFEKIDSSDIENVYISVMPHKVKKMSKVVQKFFPNKNIFLFNAETISYENLSSSKEIKYKKNIEFNNFFDEAHGSFSINDYEYSASKILYNIDKSTYNEEYIKFINNKEIPNNA